MNSDLENVALFARIAQGDETAFVQLYDRFGRAIFSLVRRMTGSDRDAEEVVQDVFVAVWSHAASFDECRSAPFTWLATIARNKACDHLRKTGRRPPAGGLDGQHANMTDHLDPSLDPHEMASLREQAKAMAGWIGSLPEEQSKPILLAFFEGLSHREIAVRLGAPLGTVKSRIRLGMANLKERHNGVDAQ